MLVVFFLLCSALWYVIFKYLIALPCQWFIARIGVVEKRCAYLSALTKFTEWRQLEEAAREADEQLRRLKSKNYPEYWKQLYGYELERELEQLFKASGYTVLRTGRTGDGGVDLKLTRDEDKIAVQSKGWEKPISPAVIRETMGARDLARCTEAWVVAVNGATSNASETARIAGIKLITAKELAEMAGALRAAAPRTVITSALAVDAVNLFGNAYSILSKAIGESSLKRIVSIAARAGCLTPDEAKELANGAATFKQQSGRLPSLTSADALEKRMAEGAAMFLRFRNDGRYG